MTRYFLQYKWQQETMTSSINGRVMVKNWDIIEVKETQYWDMLRIYTHLFKWITEDDVETKTKDKIEEETKKAELRKDVKTEIDIKELRTMYKVKYGKWVDPKKMNDYDYIYNKIYGNG